ncbi:hypothetical protein RTCIAT899_PB01625 (plasmid) [Rhizobium tropici CIAT 899]|nr:hypothetical protein RTCIAT899_PB01625 [Rhizobium tropici CIAT 899]
MDQRLLQAHVQTLFAAIGDGESIKIRGSNRWSASRVCGVLSAADRYISSRTETRVNARARWLQIR